MQTNWTKKKQYAVTTVFLDNQFGTRSWIPINFSEQRVCLVNYVAPFQKEIK